MKIKVNELKFRCHSDCVLSLHRKSNGKINNSRSYFQAVCSFPLHTLQSPSVLIFLFFPPHLLHLYFTSPPSLLYTFHLRHLHTLNSFTSSVLHTFHLLRLHPTLLSPFSPSSFTSFTVHLHLFHSLAHPFIYFFEILIFI